tara:strand:+ start:14058 stop:14732 length:675 start_codon:yes stop_codon:yes gene_type:complete
MRQHVNPLSSFFQLPLCLPEPNELFENDQLPIHLDIGCAKGKFLLEMASLDTKSNYLGIEIRKSLITSAQEERNRLELNNLQFLYCNANVSLESWISNLREDCLQKVSIQFPDPWFKRRHFKRRVLQPSLLLSLIKSFNPGAQLFIQSDILGLIQSMINLIEASECFSKVKVNAKEWLPENPFLIPTEREIYAINKNIPIYRVLYYRNFNPAPNIAFLEKVQTD